MNIKLRPTTIDDLPKIMEWVNDPDVQFYFAAEGGAISPEQEKAYLQKILASKTDKTYTVQIDGEYAGQCSINQIDWYKTKNGRLFIVLNKKFRNRSLARPVVAELLKLAFNVTHLHKVWVKISWHNKKIQFIFQRLGFSPEGVQLEEYFSAGRYYDMARMAMLETAWHLWHETGE